MKKLLLVVVALLVAALCLHQNAVNVPSNAQEKFTTESYVPGELLLKLKDGSAGQPVASLHESLGASVENEFPEIGWQHIKLPDGMAVADAIQIYRSAPTVEIVQPNYIYTLYATPNDPLLGSLYGLTRISAPQAWDTTTGDPSVVVAVIDTGIDKNHQDLAPNVWQNPGEIAANAVDDDMNGFVDDTYGWDFLNGDNDPVDGHSHGTHCSGTIGGVGNNGIGVAGVNWNVRIMALKTHDDTVGGSTSVTLIQTFGYVTMMKNRGINIRATSNSYGGPPEAGTYDQAVKDAIDASGRAGVLNVFAAGNQLAVSQERDNDILPTYPGSYNSPSILAVAASNQTDNMASFSHYGATTVDVAAPGVSILSTVPNNGYASFSGTSMSTPHTAGAAALLAAAHPGLSSASIKATLMNTVDVLPQWSGLILTGGRINVARAIAQPTVCSFTLSSYANSFPMTGGNGTFGVSSATNCGFAAFSSEPWVIVTSDPGSGNGSADFTVAPNVGSEPRTATLFVSGRIFTITQAGTGPVLPFVRVSGRVMTPDGKGLNKASVSITDSLGNTRQTLTDPSGFYRFDQVASGQRYTLVVTQKRFNFESRQVIVIGNTDNIDFVGYK
jgi:subtilisin family serine protease